MSDRPRAYSYTRMSTPEQLKGDSKRRQELLARKYAEANGLEIVDRFDDIGVSAFQGKNSELGALSEFTALVDAGDIARGSYLLVESMDRLSRQAVPKAMSLLLGLTHRGIKVAILEENRVYSDESNSEDTYALMSALVSMSRAHEESRRKSNLISSAWENKRNLARTQGKVTTRKMPGWLHLVDGNIEAIEQRVAVVREIFALTVGGYGAYSIAKKLNERSEPLWSSKKNAVWRESYIKKIIRSRTVLGEYQPHRVIRADGKLRRVPEGEPLIGYYPIVVSNLEFQEAQSAATSRSTSGKGRKGVKYANLFTGLLKCRCGAGLRYIDKGAPPKGGAYVQCSVAFLKGGCGQPRYRYDVMESVLLWALDRLDIASVLGSGNTKAKIKELKERVADLNHLCVDTRKAIGNLISAIKETELSSRMLANELAVNEQSLYKAEEEIVRCQQEIEELQRTDPVTRRRQLDDLLRRITDKDSSDQVMTRRALAGEIQRLMRKIVLKGSASVPWEIADETSDWRTKYGVRSFAELEKLCKERNFEATFVYRSGESVVFDSLDGEQFRAKKDVRMKTMELVSSGD